MSYAENNRKSNALCNALILVFASVIVTFAVVCFKQGGYHYHDPAHHLNEFREKTSSRNSFIAGTTIPKFLIQTGGTDPYPNLWTSRSPGLERSYFNDIDMKFYLEHATANMNWQFDGHHNIVFAADIFRYAAIYEHGGIWSDTDTELFVNVDLWTQYSLRPQIHVDE